MNNKRKKNKTETRSMPITLVEGTSTQSGLRALISDPKPCS
jgi:hypothetical protein